MTVEQAEAKHLEIMMLFLQDSVDFDQLARLFNDFCSEYPSSTWEKNKDSDFSKEFLKIKAKLLKIVKGINGANNSKSTYTAIILAKLTPLATTALSLANDTSQLNPTSRKEQRFCEQVSQILGVITQGVNKISYKNNVLIGKKSAISETLIDQLSPISADFQVKAYQFTAQQIPAIGPVLHTKTQKAASVPAVTAAKIQIPDQAKKTEQQAQPATASPASAISASPPPPSEPILPSKETIEERSPEDRIAAFEQELNAVLAKIKENKAYAKIAKRYQKDKNPDKKVEQKLSKLEGAINKLLTSPSRLFFSKRNQILQHDLEQVKQLRQKAINIQRGIEKETKPIYANLLKNSDKRAQPIPAVTKMSYGYMLQDLEDKSISEAMRDQFQGKSDTVQTEYDKEAAEIIHKQFDKFLEYFESQKKSQPTSMFAANKKTISQHNENVDTKIKALKADYDKICTAYEKAEKRLVTEKSDAEQRQSELYEEKAQLEEKLTALETPKTRLSQMTLDIKPPQKKPIFQRKAIKLKPRKGWPPKRSSEISPPPSTKSSTANNSDKSSQPEPTTPTTGITPTK